MTGSTKRAVKPPKAGWSLDPAVELALRRDRHESGAPETVAAMTEALHATGSRNEDYAITHMTRRTLEGVARQMARDYSGVEDLPVTRWSPRALGLIVRRALQTRRESERAVS